MPLPEAGAASFYVRSWTVDDGTSANTVMGAVRRADGYLWVATRVGLFRFNGEQFKSVPQVSQAALPGFVAPAMCEDHRGRIWVSKRGMVDLLGEVPGGMVSVLHEDARGQLWVACNSGMAGALFLHENKQFRPVPVLCPHVMGLADDKEGNLWVSTRRTGLIQVRLRTVELVNPISDMLAGVQSFCEERGGMRFAVGVNGLLASSQGEAWREMTEPLGWRGAYAECVAADPLGGVWLGTREHGLMRWCDGVFSGVDGMEDSGVGWIRSLLPSSNNELWFGTITRRLYRLREGRLTLFPVPPGSNHVATLAEDARKTIWAATQEGLLLRVDGNSLVHETPQVSTPPDAIRCLHATPDGSLWIGYATQGLGRLKQGVCRRFSHDQGIAEKAVSQILSADGDGWLWCAGDRGIFRVKLAELEAVAAGTLAKVHPVLCGRGEGWPVMQASCETWPQATRSRSGELCMPMTTGLAIIHPQPCLEHPPQPPVVLLDRLTVNGRCVAVYENGLVEDGEHGGPPAAELRGHAANLSLGRGVRQLGIEYDVVSFTGRENVRFRYRMEGLEKTWVEAGPQRVAYFSMMPPGRYRFQVTACNNHGVWNDTGTSLEFTVVPYYWQTSWFRGLLLMATAGSAGGAVWLETRRRHRRKLERLERELALESQRAEHQRVLEEERARIARDLHDDLGASLTEVAVLAATGQHAPAADQTPRLFEAIGGKLGQMVAALDAIVWAVDPQEDSLQSLVDYLAGFAGDYLASTRIACRFKIPVAFPAIQLPGNVRHELFLIVKETVNITLRVGDSTAATQPGAHDE